MHANTGGTQRRWQGIAHRTVVATAREVLGPAHTCWTPRRIQMQSAVLGEALPAASKYEVWSKGNSCCESQVLRLTRKGSCTEDTC